ncbi:hypothetical protein DU478_15370 [Thalassococcus profundi]|uniref:Uncharacterized protein n=1 Tax=Thalassococcus profundi TaxID=2282382 RepID=A0A369TLI7_9RHOB|nr:hypothetical protein DU478_15370 [Thalassococcus profundi]
MAADLGVENSCEIISKIIAGKPTYDSSVILGGEEKRVVTIQVIEDFSSSIGVERCGVAICQHRCSIISNEPSCTTGISC